MSELRELNLKLWMKFHGDPPPYRVRGVAVMSGDDPVAIGGIGFHKSWLEVFMDMKPEACRYPKLLLKGGRKVIEMGSQYGLPMIATQDPDHESAPRFLSRLGFEHVEGEVWRHA